MKIMTFACLFVALAVRASGEDQIVLPGEAQAQILSPVETKITIVNLQPEVSRVSGDYKIEIFYFAKRTRSEGVHGVLFIKGEEVIGKSPEEVIKTPFGTYVWHGSLKDRKVWGPSGWLPKELSSVYPSWEVKAGQEAANQP